MKFFCYLVLLTIIVSGCCENEETVTEEQYEEVEEIRDGKQIGDVIEAQVIHANFKLLQYLNISNFTCLCSFVYCYLIS